MTDDLLHPQAALKIPALQHHALIAVAPQLMWLNYADGSIASFSRQWFTYTGAEPAAMQGTGWLAHIHPADRTRIARERAEAIDRSAAYEMEMRIRRADGVYRWHFAQVVPLPDADGPGWLGIAIDIHERRRSENALRLLAEAGAVLSQSLDLQTLLGDVTRLVVAEFGDYSLIDVLQDDGRIARLAASHADPTKQHLVERARHFPPIRVESSALFRVISTGHPDWVPVVSTDWIEGAAYSPVHRAIIDELGPQSLIIVPLHARGRTIGALTIVSTDPQRRYDAADLTLAQNLAARVAEAIENAVLYDEAQTAVRVREQFLSIAAHELRTPLAALLGYVYLLQQRADRGAFDADSAMQRVMSSITDQGRRLDSLVNVLLDVSRLQLGAFMLDVQPLDLAALVRSAVDEQRLGLNQHTLHLQAPAGPIMILGDEARLLQVLHNLIGNAVKFSPSGGPILVSLEQRHQSATLRVRDHGIGIPAEAQPQLFEQFYRASNVDPRRISGLGIGLYIVKQIVDRHSGTIDVQSAEGQGSTISLQLPLAANTAER